MLCEAQKKMLVDFMNQNEKLRSGKFTPNFSYKTAQELWINISNQLNSVPNGVEKDWKKWRKVSANLNLVYLKFFMNKDGI